MGDYALHKARRYSWDRVAAEVVEVYKEARQALAAGHPQALEVTDVHHAV